MSTLLKVKALSKFGFFVEGEEKGLYFDRSLPESERGKFVPGAEIPVELRVTDTGTKYVTKVMIDTAPPLVAPVFKDTPLVKADAISPAVLKAYKTSTGEVKTDWQAKDRSMLLGGLSHDSAALAAAAVAYNVPISSVVDQYKLAFIALIKIRDELK